jgi:hypothetical protein
MSRLEIDKIKDFLKTKGKKNSKRKIRNFAKDEFTGILPKNTIQQAIKEFINEERFAKVSKNYFSPKMVNNYIGQWYFDIIYPRATKHDRYYYGVFLSANSKFVKYYKIKNRKNETLSDITLKFTEWADSLGIPHTRFKADAERGLEGMGIFEQFVADREHHKFGPIDSFVSAARRWSANQGHQGLPEHVMDKFVNEIWNKSVFPGIKNTKKGNRGITTNREEMVQDRDLEETYIAKGLYYNLNKRQNRDILKQGMNVEVRLPQKQRNERRNTNIMSGNWHVKQAQKYNVLIENGAGDLETVYYNQIRGVQSVDEYMLSLKKKTKPKPVYLQKQTEIVNTNLQNELETYSNVYKTITQDILNEVQKKYKKYYEREIQNGMLPPTKIEAIDEMFEQAKKQEENKRSSYDITYQKSINEIRKHGAKKIAKQILSIFPEFYPYQNCPETNADNETMIKGGEKVFKKIRKENPNLINPLFLPERVA